MAAADNHYDVIAVGTGPATMAFLHRYLGTAPATARVLLLEKGANRPYAWYVKNRNATFHRCFDHYENRTPQKQWVFNVGVGGGSICWVGQTPRMVPNDFRMKRVYGVGEDWPITYEQLETYYLQAENLMQISGDSERSPVPRSGPFPQPPHRMAAAERALFEAHPQTFFHMPTARTRTASAGRNVCCASGVCWYCPVEAKFTVLNGLGHVLEDPRVRLVAEAAVTEILHSADTASGVRYTRNGTAHTARGDLVLLGANGIFNPFILQRSGIVQKALGRYLHEQCSCTVRVELKGLENVGGSTWSGGCSYLFYDGPHRRERAGALVLTESGSLRNFRMEPGRWQQRLDFGVCFEDLPQFDNYVAPSASDPTRPQTYFGKRSAYFQRGYKSLAANVEALIAPLPVERWELLNPPSRTEAHIQGTTRMGTDPETSVIDANLVHHRLRNVVVLGSGAFPTGAPANPTLTITALSLRCADKLTS